MYDYVHTLHMYMFILTQYNLYRRKCNMSHAELVCCLKHRKHLLFAGSQEEVHIALRDTCTSWCLQVVKNKCAPPYKIAEFDIMFGSGISTLGCLLDAAEGVGVVQRKGSWYSFGDEKLGQGRDKTMALLTDNKAMQK